MEIIKYIDLCVSLTESTISPNSSVAQVQLIPPFPLASLEVAQSESFVRKFS